MKITEHVADHFITALAAATELNPADCSYEIQDEWSFLLVTISLSTAMSKKEQTNILKTAARLAEKHLPWRKRDYSWMVNLKMEGVVVDSVFGGDSYCSNSGLLGK
jgi:hypothetical protein